MAAFCYRNMMVMAPDDSLMEEIEEDPAYADLEARKAYANLSDDIAVAVENLQLFGTVDGKNFTEMGDVTNTGTISKMINQVIVQNADIDAELKKAQSAVEELVK